MSHFKKCTLKIVHFDFAQLKGKNRRDTPGSAGRNSSDSESSTRPEGEYGQAKRLQGPKKSPSREALKGPTLTDVRQRRTLPPVGEFFEAAPLTRSVDGLLRLDEFADLQGTLIARPDAGVVLERTGGCRKLRWEAKGKGKRGGARVICYWYREDGEIYLLLICAKGEKDDLTEAERKMLRNLIEGP